MKSNVLIVSVLFALSLSACSSESKKYENTQVPEMTTEMPAEISTTNQPAVEAAPEAVKVKRVEKKKTTTKKKTTEN